MAPAAPMPSPGEFEPDDYEEVNEAYFQDLLRRRSWAALPAGWHNPHSAAAEHFLPPRLTSRDHQQYALDEGGALGATKKAIVELASRWEGRSLLEDEVTLCPSVSSANLAILCAMRRRGVERIVFETPAYFATPEQARLLGFEIDRIPSARADDFDAPIEKFTNAAHSGGRSALWLTQPRFGIGKDQALSRIKELAAALGERHVLVLDEAGEQRHPSHLSGLGDVGCDVVRARGVTKGVGLNGLRISMVLHPRHWRDDLERVLETAGASIDRYSLMSAAELASSPLLLPAMLRAANHQVCTARQALDRILLGSWATPTPLENSYIGSVLLDLSTLPGTYADQRSALLAVCRDLRMPVVLRASIGFAFDPAWEAIRMNYFTPEENVVETGRMLNLAHGLISARLAQTQPIPRGHS